MKVFTGTKIINAMPMTLGAYNELQGWELPIDQSPLTEGYLVEYTDSLPNHPNFSGYISWSPKAVFEAAYLEVPNLTVGMRTGLKAHEVRVLAEMAALNNNREKLSKFLYANHSSLAPEDYNLMHTQARLMTELVDILSQRIARFAPGLV